MSLSSTILNSTGTGRPIGLHHTQHSMRLHWSLHGTRTHLFPCPSVDASLPMGYSVRSKFPKQPKSESQGMGAWMQPNGCSQTPPPPWVGLSPRPPSIHPVPSLAAALAQESWIGLGPKCLEFMICHRLSALWL